MNKRFWASQNDEGDSIEVRIVIAADGQVTSIQVMQGSDPEASSGSLRNCSTIALRHVMLRIVALRGAKQESSGREAVPIRSSIGSTTLVLGFLLMPPIAGLTPAACQDFSITNQVAPVDVGRRDLLRQLQAWWDVHGYYPKHAADNNEGGTVKIRLAIRSDGNISTVLIVESSGSQSLDSAAYTAFHEGFVRPLSADASATSLDLSLHYVLTHRHGQPPGTYAAVSSKRSFTVTNEPVTSPVVNTMLQRSCTGTVVKQGIRNHPAYGIRNWAKAIFFRRPDGTPWVKFYEGGFGILAPVVEIGKIVKWAGRVEYLGGGSRSFTEYTLWAEADNSLNGSIKTVYLDAAKASQLLNRSGTIDLSCGIEVVPAVAWNASSVTPIPTPAGDPP